ncbi:hypothetical protein EGW08_013474, partial [Elysia chlorotica]
KQTSQETSPSPQAPPRRKHSLTPATNTESDKQEDTTLTPSKEITPDTDTGEKSKLSNNSTGIEGASSNVKSEIIVKVEEQIQKLLPEAHTASISDKDAEDKAPNKSKEEAEVKTCPLTEHFNEAAVDVVEIAAVSASVAAVESEMVQNDPEEGKDTGKLTVKTGSVSSDSDKQSKVDTAKERNEKKRLEKERLKKEKDAERAKEKERLKEEKKKKAEQKAADKEKSKNEKKIKVPKRLSSLFQRKEKHLKQVAEGAEDSSPTDQAASQPVTEPELADTSLPQTVDTMVCPVEQAPAQDSSEANSENTTLGVGVSVEPLTVTTSPENGETCLESKPENGDMSSTPPQSPLESPQSDELKGSDTSEPTSPSSDCDVNGSSAGSGVLKKISLGPRLRTAILRKKSSGASDSGAERTVSLTTPKSVAESCDNVTPPPRKFRPRKPVEQYSPVTPGAHNLHTPSPVPEAHDYIKLNDSSEQADSFADNLGARIDTVVEYESHNDKSVSYDDNENLKNGTSQNESPKAGIEPESVVCEELVKDKHAANDVPIAIDNVLDSVTTVPFEQTLQQLHVSKVSSEISQDKVSEVPVSGDSTLVVEPIMEASTNKTVCCEIVNQEEKNNDVIDNTEVNGDSDTDDTDPSQLKMPLIQEQQQQSQPGDDEELDTFSSLPSPTVISTASIVLRPSSVDDTCPEAEISFEEWIEPSVKKVATKSSAVQTEYVKTAPPVDSDSISSASQSIACESESEEKSPSLQLTAEKLAVEVNNGLFSSVDDGVSKEETIPDIVTASDKDAADGHPENQVYTEVCTAQVQDDAKEGAPSEAPIEEEAIVASSKPRAILTIAEYLIGTFEETPQADTTSTAAKEENSDHNLQDGVAIADSFIADDGVPSADVTLTEDTTEASMESRTEDENQGHSSEDSEGSGQQTPTPSQRQDTVESVINGIVNEAVNGVLHAECAGKSDESMESEKSPPCSPKADEAEVEEESKKVISVENNTVSGKIPSVTDDNKNAVEVADNNDIIKDNGRMKENTIKPSPTETIEAYLKLQYQETGESISSPFVNGEKGFEENGNVLMSPPSTAPDVSLAQDEQVTG